MFLYAMRKNLYGLVSIVSDDNLCHFASYSWWVLEMIFRNIATQWLIQQFVLVEVGGYLFRSWEVWGGRWNPCQCGPVGVRYPENFGYFAFRIAQNIALVAQRQRTVTICLFLDEPTFTLLRVWVSEFGIPNGYTSFKIALHIALPPNSNFVKL